MYAEKITSIHPITEHTSQLAIVLEVNAETVLISHENNTLEASVAFSCLVKPKVGDNVMFSHVENHGTVILAIITRTDSQALELNFKGDVMLASEKGKLSLHAGQEVNITSNKNINLLSHAMSFISETGLFNIRKAKVNGDTLTSTISAITTLAKSIDIVADRLTQSLKYSIRNIKGMDQTKAGDVLLSVKNLFSLRSKQAALLAKNDLKVDAKRIHMG